MTEDLSPEDAASAHPIVLYDGVCGLCNRLVQFILQRDPAGLFRFAPLQGTLAVRVLARHGVVAQRIDTVWVVIHFDQPDEQLLARSDAVVFILKHLGIAGQHPVVFDLTQHGIGPSPAAVHPGRGSTFWRAVALAFECIPHLLRDWGYRVVAINRYQLFGRYDTCPLPSEETRSRFIDL